MNNDFFEELNKQDEELRKDKQNIKDNSNSNGISSIIKVLCWVLIVLGFIVGILDTIQTENPLTLINTWAIYSGSALGGFALAEIIQILHDIRNRLYKMKKWVYKQLAYMLFIFVLVETISST